ncbi:MAG TPA: hypothetical protein VEV42_08400 [Pyrinomonadaceae bacterium]|nr:hypothetical protein [Pyrinomonadaceae bacterium]
MSEEDLELLITLDDPEGAPEEDTFHHVSAECSRVFTARLQPDQQAEGVE